MITANFDRLTNDEEIHVHMLYLYLLFCRIDLPFAISSNVSSRDDIVRIAHDMDKFGINIKLLLYIINNGKRFSFIQTKMSSCFTTLFITNDLKSDRNKGEKNEFKTLIKSLWNISIKNHDYTTEVA